MLNVDYKNNPFLFVFKFRINYLIFYNCIKVNPWYLLEWIMGLQESLLQFSMMKLLILKSCGKTYLLEKSLH